MLKKFMIKSIRAYNKYLSYEYLEGLELWVLYNFLHPYDREFFYKYLKKL